MPVGSFGGRRPGSNSSLKLVIRETPVPDSDPEGVFPEPLLRAGATDEDIMEDISDRTVFNEQDISLNRTNKFTRGLGETRTWGIMVDVDGLQPSSVAKSVERLVDAGYVFDDVSL